MVTDDFYRALEDRFRGSRDAIKARQRVYLPVIDALAATVSKKILDVGFGRAEWLELLKEQGLAAEGLDLSDSFVEEGRRAGFDVSKGDVIDYLARQPDQTYSLISAFHVVEHLGFDKLLAFLREAHRVTDANGAILLETPNPANLVVGACNFYIDPTHERPIPSTLLAFAAEYCGFARVVMVPMNRDFLHNDLQLMAGHSSGATVVNAVVSEVNDTFKQAPDYAIFAFKKMDNEAVKLAESLVTKPVLPVSAAEPVGADSLWARVVEVETDRAVWRGKAALAEAQLQHVQELVARADSRIRDFEARVRELQSRSVLERSAIRAQEQDRVHDVEAQLKKALRRAMAAEELAADAQLHIDAMLRSSSWRLSAPVRGVGLTVRKVVGLRRLATTPVRLSLLHAAAFVRSRPALRRRIVKVLSRVPGLRAGLIRLAGFNALQGVLNDAAANVVETVDQLTARGRKIHDDLLSARHGYTR
jgi:SAM-dependent methyltransferase